MEKTYSRKNKTVNFLLKILLIVIAVVGLSSVALCYIPKTYSVNLNDSNITAIKIYKNGIAQSVVYKSERIEKFNEIYNKYSDSLKTTFVNALFKGKLSSQEEMTYKYQYNVYTQIASSTSKCSIMFDYNQTQEIQYRGAKYESSENTTAKTYNQVLIEVSDSNEIADFVIYYVNASSNSYYRVTVSGVQHELYEYIQNFEL